MQQSSLWKRHVDDVKSFDACRNLDIGKIDFTFAYLTARWVDHIKILADVDDARIKHKPVSFPVDAVMNTNGTVLDIETCAVPRVLVNASIPGVGNGNAGKKPERMHFCAWSTPLLKAKKIGIDTQVKVFGHARH